MAVGCLQPTRTTNGDSNLPIHDLVTLVTIIFSGHFLKHKGKKMLHIENKLDTFRILGREEFSKGTNTRSWENINNVHILQLNLWCSQVLFISIHKIEESYWKYWCEILGQKTEKMQLLITHFICHLRSWSVQTSLCKRILQFSVFVKL